MKRIYHLSNEPIMDSGDSSVVEKHSPPYKRSKLNNIDNLTNKDFYNNLTSHSNGNIDTNMNDIINDNLDEGLYSRQLYVLGKEAMKKMAASNILVCGLDGLGVEISKNIILSGVKSVTLWDNQISSILDLSSQFYINHSDIGTNRAKACVSKLAELNPYVSVSFYDGTLDNSYLKNFQVVVLSNFVSDKTIINFNNFCHTSNIAFILANSKGLSGQIFCDFGHNFICHDVTGEPTLSIMISAVTKEENGVVTCLDDNRHGLEDGDYVTFSEIKGMLELNDCKPIQIKVLGPYTFCIGDTRSFGDYCGGGIAHQVKMPKKIEFEPYNAAFLKPQFVSSDCAKFDRPAILHIAFRALNLFYDKFQRLPSFDAQNKDDYELYLGIVKSLKNQLEPNDTTPQRPEVLLSENETKILTLFFNGIHGQVCPIDSVIGGVAAQEVMKACSGKFNPLRQWFYFDSFECLVENEDYQLSLSYNDLPEHYKRYSSQILIFGKEFQDKLAKQKCFLVGAGAIGCELLKLFAMIGLSCSQHDLNVKQERGKLIITDMDNIEKSNLNRQFLFRPWDVNKLKSEVAQIAAQKMNSNFNIIAHCNRVGPETERVYDDKFFEDLNIVINALDNIDARIYMDRRCVYYRKPLLESGTLGTKGNTQVILPDLTESYSSSNDPPEKSIPICTLKNFPNQIEHCIQWARDLFEGFFKQAPTTIKQYVSNAQTVNDKSDPNLYAGIITSNNQGNNLNLNVETLQVLKSGLVDERCLKLADAVIWARKRFDELFTNNIKQLLFNFPPDQVTNSGAPFWSGPKRCPKPIEFDSNNPMHLDFIMSGTLLRCQNYGIIPLQSLPPDQDLKSYITSLVQKIHLPKFNPKSGVKIFVTDNEATAGVNAPGQTSSLDSDVTSSTLDKLKSILPSPNEIKQSSPSIMPIDFEKDDDTNYHMDFITAASNLRATNYGITSADRLKTKQIAGKIIPAIATSTAVVAGLVCLELFKIVQGKKKLEDYKNGFFNLALPYMEFSEPLPPKKLKYYDKEFTLWDRIEIQGDITLHEFLRLFQEKHKLEVTMLSHGVSMLYSFFTAPDKKKERLPMKMSELVRRVTKKKIDPWVHSLVFELCCNDTEGEDVEIPFIKYNLPPNFHASSSSTPSKTPPSIARRASNQPSTSTIDGPVLTTSQNI